MTECTFIPQGKLAPYIEHFYYSDGNTPPSGLERVLPSGSAQLIINLGADHFRHFKDDNSAEINSEAAVIVGVNSQYIFLDPRTRISTIGATFKPGGIQALFNCPSIEFLNRAVSLCDVIAADTVAYRNRLIDATSAREKFRLLGSILLNQLNEAYSPNAAVIRAVHLLKNQPAAYSVSKLADDIGYSRRRFSTLFRQAAGIAPKKYMRIQRFQHCLRAIRSHPNPNWPQLALAYGYYDQAHFNRDFKILAGLTPTEYFNNQTDEKNHLPA